MTHIRTYDIASCSRDESIAKVCDNCTKYADFCGGYELCVVFDCPLWPHRIKCRPESEREENLKFEDPDYVIYNLCSQFNDALPIGELDRFFDVLFAVDEFIFDLSCSGGLSVISPGMHAWRRKVMSGAVFLAGNPTEDGAPHYHGIGYMFKHGKAWADKEVIDEAIAIFDVHFPEKREKSWFESDSSVFIAELNRLRARNDF